MTTVELLRQLPAIGEFLASTSGQCLVRHFGAGLAKWELRNTLEELRADLRAGRTVRIPDESELREIVGQRLRRLASTDGRRAINGTGILLHTGLGRAPLCEAAVQALQAAAGYTPLQTSLDSGDRSLREEKVQRLLQELLGPGCEAATVTNNNAAATLLILNTLAAGKEVIISRGQLIEIGGSFRMTEVMAQSGAILREVGTTNRTHLRDYESAIGERTGALIHVHTSNYRVRGFAGTPGIAELAALGHRHNLPVIDDLGSGAIVPLSEWGVSDEPLVRESLGGNGAEGTGADVVCFSADKLICGPQAGLICGKADILARIRRNPYARMFRVCKLTLAALEATLLEFINGTFRANLPFYRMLDRHVADLDPRAQRLAVQLREIPGLNAIVDQDISYIGSGSIPDEGIATRIVRLRHRDISSGDLARRLRMGMPSVFGRIADGDFIVDVRTLEDRDDEPLCAAVRAAIDTRGNGMAAAEIDGAVESSGGGPGGGAEP